MNATSTAIKLCTVLMLLSNSLSNSQNVTLLKNYNPKVQELNHGLNKSKDSLSLSCECQIDKVDIFNEDYDKSFEVKNQDALIPLNELSEGKFVVEVFFNNKIAEMHIVKYNYGNDSKTSNNNSNTKNIIEGNGMMLDEKLNVVKSVPKHSIEFLLTKSKAKKSDNKKQKLYWVELEINNGNNSHKTKKLVDETAVERLIKKNKLQTKMSFTRLNKLTIWEVYDTSKFMEKQFADPSYVHSSNAEHFNPNPYYDSSNTESSESI